MCNSPLAQGGSLGFSCGCYFSGCYTFSNEGLDGRSRSLGYAIEGQQVTGPLPCLLPDLCDGNTSIPPHLSIMDFSLTQTQGNEISQPRVDTSGPWTQIIFSMLFSQVSVWETVTHQLMGETPQKNQTWKKRLYKQHHRNTKAHQGPSGRTASANRKTKEEQVNLRYVQSAEMGPLAIQIRIHQWQNLIPNKSLPHIHSQPFFNYLVFQFT